MNKKDKSKMALPVCETASAKKYKRKLKELTAQTSLFLLTQLRSWKKGWSKSSLMGSGCFLNISVLGGETGFEAFIDGQAFDENIRPAIQKAMEETLRRKQEYLDYESRNIENELNPVKKTKS